MTAFLAALLLLVAPRSVRAQELTGQSVPLTYEQQASQNAAVAAKFEEKHHGRPVAFEDTRNIVALSSDQNPIYKIEDIIADFKKNRKPGQTGILVVLKTEFCCDNIYHPCAVATAALENMSPPALGKFRIYGAWIKNRSARPDLFTPQFDKEHIAAIEAGADHDELKRRFPEQSRWFKWSSDIIKYYSFQLGPGANFFFINPEADLSRPVSGIKEALERGIVVRTDADRVGYEYGEDQKIDWTQGMQRQIDEVLASFKPAS